VLLATAVAFVLGQLDEGNFLADCARTSQFAPDNVRSEHRFDGVHGVICSHRWLQAAPHVL